MPKVSNVQTWAAEPFLGEATAWVTAAAGSAGTRLTGEREQPHLRPWSSAIRYGAEPDDLWFKVNGRGTRHEGALVGVLGRLEPSLVPPVLAVDVDRGWSLTRDAGPVMRSVAAPEDLWDAWTRVLVRYGEAQLRLAAHVEQIRSTGLEDTSPARLPGHLRELLGELADVPPDAGGVEAEELRRFEACLPEYDEWCAELAASDLPLSVQHDDLHSSNICWGGTADSASIIDWGDASIGFPLATMLCTLNSIAWHVKTEVHDPRVCRVRDAYLDVFSGYADHAALVRYVELARRTGGVARALSYRAALLGEPVATHREHDFPVRDWLRELLPEEDPLTR